MYNNHATLIPAVQFTFRVVSCCDHRNSNLSVFSRPLAKQVKTPGRPRQRLFRAHREQGCRFVPSLFHVPQHDLWKLCAVVVITGSVIPVLKRRAQTRSIKILFCFLPLAVAVVPSGAYSQTSQVENHQPRQSGSHGGGVQRGYPRVSHCGGNVLTSPTGPSVGRTSA